MTSKLENQTTAFAEDSDIISAIKKKPLKYRLQLAALNEYLRTKREKEENLKQQARDLILNYSKTKNSIIYESNKIISGERAVNGQELNYASKYMKKEEKTNISKEINQDPISDYWFDVIMNCKRVSGDIYDVDHPLLKKLIKIENEPEEENKYNFKLKFTFESNEYFHNEVLSIRIVMSSQGDEIRRIEASPIQWKEGKNITVRLVQRKQQNKKTGETRFIKKILPNDSFFRIFQSKRSRGTAQEQERIVQEMEEVFDIAQAFRDEVLNYHLEYYLGHRKTALDFISEYDDIIQESKGSKAKALKKANKEQILKQKEAKKPDGTTKGDEKKRGLFCCS